MRARWWRKETNGLIAIRGRFLGFLVSLFLFVFAMSFIAPWDGGDERWVPWAVAALGVYSLAAMAWIRRRPLVSGSPEALAGSYRARFFIGVGLAQSAALFGLAGVFLGGSLWIYLVGLAFGLVAFWMIAPLAWISNEGNARSPRPGHRSRFWMPSLPFQRHRGAWES
jgi:hypothetical protein